MSLARRFGWYELRTTDARAAARFYAEVVGFAVQTSDAASTFLLAGSPVAGLVELPERARAAGAPAHFLGHVHIADLRAELHAWTSAGALQLGPTQRAAEGELAIVRDPQGAVFALSTRSERTKREDAIAWHELHTTEREQAFHTYAARFGWTATESLELGPPVGAYQMFAWRAGEPSRGAVANTARLAHVHTHWLFYLSVPSLDAALDKVRALGGNVASGPMRAPSGDRVAVCEDAQGAAFGLREAALT